MEVASKIIFFVLPIVFLVIVVIIFFGQSGQWEELKDIVLGIKDVVPIEAGVGLEELSADVSVSIQHKQQVSSLNKTISSMLGSGKENCFANYGGFTELGEKGTSIILSLKGDKTVLTIGGGSGGEQIVTDLTVEYHQMVPCVIAGQGNVAKHFFNYFLEGENQLIFPYFSPVKEIKISYETEDFNGHHIAVPSLGDSVNDEGDNLEDQGWLFTPDGQHICFFPTNKVVNYDDDGIDNDFFQSEEINSLPSKIKRGGLKLC